MPALMASKQFKVMAAINGLPTVDSVHAGTKRRLFLAAAMPAVTIREIGLFFFGLGQVLPLKKDMSQLAQLGLVGYDQWQVSSNGGDYLLAGVSVAASRVPYYPRISSERKSDETGIAKRFQQGWT